MSRILLTTDAVGGVWTYSLDLAAQFAADGLQVVLAVLGPAPDAAQRRAVGAISGVAVHETGLALDWTAPDPAALHAAAHGLAALARREDVAHVHLHAPALLGDADWPVPVVVVAHSCVGTWWQAVRGGALPADLAWRADATAAGLRRAAAVIAPSAAFAAQLRTVYGLQREIVVVHNGRAPLSLPHTACTGWAITAGRLWDEGKNIASLDEAAALIGKPVLAAGPLAGPDGHTVQLRHMQPLGALDARDLARNLASAAVFASVPVYEPFGLAVLEAAQAGLALVLSDIPTLRELWDGAALFVPPRDRAAIAAGLRDVLAAPDHWGQRAQRHAARYTPHAMAQASWAVHGIVVAKHNTKRKIDA